MAAQRRGRAPLASPGVGRLRAKPGVAATASRRVCIAESHTGLHPASPITLPRPVASDLSRSPHLPRPWSHTLYIPAVYAMLLGALT
jgi:hypothetical protein